MTGNDTIEWMKKNNCLKVWVSPVKTGEELSADEI
jgi:hypothetical protein